MVAAVVFDMDGVLVDTEHVWDEVREQLAADWGGRYMFDAQRAMMGMSSPEWSRYMRDAVGLAQTPEEINEEVARGKPAPDVYLEAARRLGVDPSACVAVEDSSNGIRSAHAAGMRVIAYPNRTYPPEAGALALATRTIDRLSELAGVVDR